MHHACVVTCKASSGILVKYPKVCTVLNDISSWFKTLEIAMGE